MTKAHVIATIVLISLLSPNLLLSSQASTTSLSISSGSHQTINLGQINESMEIRIDYSVSDDIDTILMTSGQYTAWQNGNTAHIESGSDYNDDNDDYIFTTTSTDTYYLIFDNSGSIGSASATGTTVTGDVDVLVSTPSPQHLKTRAWVDVDSFVELDIGSVQSGKIISTSVSCDIGITSSDDLDFLYMDSLQTSTLQTSQWDWNSHNSFEDTCSHSWEYETGKQSGWSFIVDNTDNARTSGLNNAISVDIDVKVRNLVPLVEIADTSRMIDDGDYYRIDLGYQIANSVVDIDYSFWSHGTGLITDDLDVMVMKSTEADKYENNNDADILGHTSELDASSQSWSYQFPVAGSYSIIFDNTDEPSGGAGDGSDIQVEIGVTSLTIPSLFGNIWSGWHQSRHYADEGDYMALDLGSLNAGEDIYYYVDGKNVGGSIFSSKEFDILFMTKQNYDQYANGSTATMLSSGTKYKENGLIPAIANITVASTDHYMLVFDAADGPNSNAADENGDWIWEFIVLSEGSTISNLQAQDNQYENPITVGTINAPDSDSDGVRNGNDECPSTPSGANVDTKGCTASELDSDGDSISNAVDLCPSTPTGESVNANGCAQSQLDDDGDGVSNAQDQCPNTPAGANVDANGCEVITDSDGDGVSDAADQCPNTPAGATVDANGCEIITDSDGDGISDAADQCPNTPAGESVNANGCAQSQLDDDGDGVTNTQDQCPSTPAGESVNTTGCAQSQLDDDGDGVTNTQDQCPSTPAGESVNTAGCAQSQLDDDDDGVSNAQDQCPNTPAGANVDANGCEIITDSDGDGVNDAADQCPNTPAGANVDENGCKVAADSDDDGVSDATDQCPNTMENELVNQFGCALSQLDDDGDGVSNAQDQCPNTNNGNTVDVNGCTFVIQDTVDESEEEEDSSPLPGFTTLIASLSILFAVGYRKLNDE